MSETRFKRWILHAVLREMVIRSVAVPDYLEVGDFDDVSMPSWVGMAESAIRSRFTVQPGFTLARLLIRYDSKCEEQRRPGGHHDKPKCEFGGRVGPLRSGES